MFNDLFVATHIVSLSFTGHFKIACPDWLAVIFHACFLLTALQCTLYHWIINTFRVHLPQTTNENMFSYIYITID